MKQILFVLTLLLAANNSFAVRSDLVTVKGIKHPNSLSEGLKPVVISVQAFAPGAKAGGFDALLPFVMAAPDQEEAGSCLYMSLTGIAEWFLASRHPSVSRAAEGPLDLSERHLMNVAGNEESQNGIAEWKTDSVFLFNGMRGMLRNSQYRFTKGWWKENSSGDYVKAAAREQGATYDAGYNWVDQRPNRGELVSLPKFRREVLFADPESNQWNTGIMPADIVGKIKNALVTNKAPVQIIYNHLGYWHANYIVGFNDETPNENCKFVREFLDFMKKRGQELRKEASQKPVQRDDLIAKAQRAEEAYAKTFSAYQRGGCKGKGVFYVRDSIYPDEKNPASAYDYDRATKGDEGFYSKKVVLLEYEWVHYMGNHALQILAD